MADNKKPDPSPNAEVRRGKSPNPASQRGKVKKKTCFVSVVRNLIVSYIFICGAGFAALAWENLAGYPLVHTLYAIAGATFGMMAGVYWLSKRE